MGFAGTSGSGTTRQPDRPPSNIAASAEVQAWIAKLEAQSKKVGRRNKLLAVGFAVGILLLIAVLFGLYQASVRCYAMLDDVTIFRNPANQGRLQFSFRVVSPGKVFYRRKCGGTLAEVVDYFDAAGDVQRAWSWVYEPGKDIELSMLFRGGLWRRTVSERFPTAKQADIVLLMDTTGSMSRCINLLKERCTSFSRKLKDQSLEHRFALIGFGDTQEGEWLDRHPFSGDVEQFRESVAGVKRFDGGDLPESALDALEAALQLPFSPGAIRRFYLVTDAPYHEPSQSGATATDIAARLAKEQVLLEVFSRGEFQADYGKLIGRTGRFREIEDFGEVLAEGRILED
jgi:hypothetical protein